MTGTTQWCQLPMTLCVSLLIAFDVAVANDEDIGEIASAVVENRSGVVALRVRTEQSSSSTAPVEDLPRLYGVVGLLQLKEDFAWKWGRFRYERLDRSTIASPVRTTSVSDAENRSLEHFATDTVIVNRRTTRIFDGEFIAEYNDTGPFAVIDTISSKNKRSPARNFSTTYMSVVHWFLADPSADAMIDQQMSHQCFPQILEIADSVQLQDVELGSRHCVLIELSANGDRHRFWLDRERGFMVRRHEIYDEKANLLIQEVKNDNETEISRGLWLPTRSQRVRYLRNAARRTQATLTTNIKVESIEVNDGIPDDLFVVEFPSQLYAVADFGATEKAGMSLDKPLFRAPLDIEVSERRLQGNRLRLLVATGVVVSTILFLVAYRRFWKSR